jgi:hypothetical protein
MFLSSTKLGKNMIPQRTINNDEIRHAKIFAVSSCWDLLE